MAEIKVRLFGFGSKACNCETKVEVVPVGTTVSELWEYLRKSAGPDSSLARTRRETVLVLVNEQPFPQGNKWEASLKEGDTVGFMVLAMGG